MISDPLDVVVVPFPFTDRRAAKRRSALVVSSTAFNAAHPHSVLAMITSTTSDWPSDVVVRDWKQTGLDVPCKVRLKLFTLDNDLIIRRVGALSRRDGNTVRRSLSHFLAVDGGDARRTQEPR